MILIKDVIFDETLGGLEVGQHIIELYFSNCTFKSLYFKEFRPDGHFVLRFQDCAIEILDLHAVPSDKILSLDLSDCSIAELHVKGAFKHFGLRNPGKTKRVVGILSFDRIYVDSNYAVSYTIDNQNIKELTFKEDDAELHMTRCEVEFVNGSFSKQSGTFIANHCKIKFFHIHYFLGRVDISKSKIGLILLTGLQGIYPMELTSLLEIDTSDVNNLTVSSEARVGKIILSRNVAINCLNLKGGVANNVIVQCKQINYLFINLGFFSFDQIQVSGSLTRLRLTQIMLWGGVLGKGPKGQPAVIQLDHLSVSHFCFRSFINQGNFLISDVVGDEHEMQEIPDLLFPDISNSKYVFWIRHSEIATTYWGNTLEFDSSDLGRINFISCDFSKMTLLFRSSKIVEIFLAGTIMPSDLLGDVGNQQIGYGQLKKVYENRGDSIAGLLYQRKELTAHLESLKKKNLPSGKRTWIQSGDYITLKISRLTNDFGSNWILALFVFVIPTIVLFIAHNLAIGYKMGSWNSRVEIKNFWEILSLFPEFIFPIHKADYIPEAVKMPVTPWSRFWDTVGKIWGSFMIYQFVQAFRKYGKR